MMTAQSQQDRARRAANMLRHCCRKACLHLADDPANVRTTIQQIRQTVELAELELEPKETSPARLLSLAEGQRTK